MRRGVAAAAVLALIALVVVLLASRSDLTDRPDPVNGDQLGMESYESVADYRSRAADSLAKAPADRPVWALVTFAAPLDVRAADEATRGLDRVSAVVAHEAGLIEVPEPVAGATRADVFARELDRAPFEADRLDGVVAYDDGSALRALTRIDDVAVVEALPSDAAWGRIGVRPVVLH